MNTDQWKKIKQLFNDAADLPPNEQLSWLEQHAAKGSEVYNQVKQMLDADAAAQHSLTHLVGDKIDSSVFAELSLHPGDKLGPYQINALIGEGGMGAVFLASRHDDEFDQKVAIKIITSKSLSKDSVQRFQRERQILATLNHNNIARLFDGGTTENNLPYLTMEFIDGVDFFTYVKTHRLSLPERLKLFLQVCDAISYAHKNLVVHRDIKSSNILVNKQGIVKLLDFGVAKIIQNDDIEDDQNTRIEVRILTPRSASPEQVRGEAITTGTDVYALGALLYELLTDSPLFETSAMTRSELERTICEVTPKKPSEVLSEKSQSEKNHALSLLAKQVVGDLDTIVLKALQKDVSQRYTSVDAMTDDIFRYLHHFPIQARPQNLSYKTKRFLQRHTFASATSFLLISFIVIGTIYIWYQSEELREQRNQAVKQATIAQETKDFLVELFQSADPHAHSGKIPNAIELLNTGIDKIDTLETGDEIKLNLLLSIADVFNTLGEYDHAKETLDKAEELRIQMPSVSLEDQINLIFFQSNWAYYQGDYEESLALNEKILTLIPNDWAEGEKFSLRSKREIGLNYAVLNRHEESIDIMRNVLDAYSVLYGAESLEVADAATELGHSFRDVGNFEDSLRLLKQANTIYVAQHGEQHLNVAYTLNQMASTLIDMERYDEALPLALSGLQIRRNILKEHEEVAASLGNVSRIYTRQGDYENSILYRLEATNILRAVIDPQHPYIASSLHALGVLQENAGKTRDAYHSYQQAYAISSKAMSPTRESAVKIMESLSRLEMAEGDVQKGVELAEAAYRNIDGNKNISTYIRGKVTENLGVAYLKTNDTIQAKKFFSEAIAVYDVDPQNYKERIEQILNMLNSI